MELLLKAKEEEDSYDIGGGVLRFLKDDDFDQLKVLIKPFGGF